MGMGNNGPPQNGNWDRGNQGGDRRMNAPPQQQNMQNMNDNRGGRGMRGYREEERR